MARREVIEITCSRCGRVEVQSSSEAPKTQGAEFEGTLHGKKVSFDDLCKMCRKTVENYFLRIEKKTAEDPLPEKRAPIPLTNPVKR